MKFKTVEPFYRLLIKEVPFKIKMLLMMKTIKDECCSKTCDVTCKYTCMFKVASDRTIRISNP